MWGMATDKDIITKIGTAALVDALGVSVDVVKKWRKRGIPWQYRARVAKLAAERKVKVRADFAERRAA